MTTWPRQALGELWLAGDRRSQLLQRSLRVDEATYERIVDRRITMVVEHARRHAPGWARRLEAAGLDRVSDPGRLVLQRLEPIGRVELQRHGDELSSDDLHERRWYQNSSGGSTGEPVSLVQDRDYLRWARATKALFDTWTGYRPGQPKLVLWGAARDLDRGSAARRRLLRRLKHEHWVDAYRLDEGSMHAWADLVDRLRPMQVLGYAESLDLWARFLLEQGRTVAPPGAVMSTAGVLTPQMRGSIARAFNAPVFDRYGSREVGDIASETPEHDGLAIPPWHVHVELLDTHGHPVGPGEEGDVVVTSLSNLAMPLLRYRLGDRARWAAFPAGIRPGPSAQGVSAPAWPRLASVTGRRSDHLVGPDGSLLHVGAIRTALYGIRGVDAYQVVQDGPERLLLRIEAAALPPDLAEELHRRLRDALATSALRGAHVEVGRVDRLDRGPTGKLLVAVPWDPEAPPR